MRALTEKQMDLLRKLEKHELLEILEELVIPNTHNLLRSSCFATL